MTKPPGRKAVSARRKPVASRFAGWLTGVSSLGIAIAILVPVITAVLAHRAPKADAPTFADLAIEANASPKIASVKDAAPAPPPVVPGPTPVAAVAAVGDATSQSLDTAKIIKPAVQAPPLAAAQPLPVRTDAIRPVVIQGLNPAKPASVLFVTGKDPTVLFKKERQDLGDGTRIAVAAGTIASITIAENDIFRVDQGGATSIFYQGRKVAAQTIASGAWMSFVPQLRATAGE
jgi:hypothetical protein